LALSGIEWEPGSLNPYAGFQAVRPDAVIAGGMLVYRGTFDLTGAVAVSHIALAMQAMGAGKCDVAIREARDASLLTPTSVRAHLAAGEALAACRRMPEARIELNIALDLAEKRPEWYPLQIAEAGREIRKLSQ